MKKLLLCIALIFAARQAHATACNLAAGSSQATITAAASAASTNSCTGTVNGATVTLAAGSYNWTSTWAMPCGSTKWTLTGPTVPIQQLTIGGTSYRVVTPTAVITSSVSGTNNWFYGSCNTGFDITYLEFNGNRPSSGGGGFLTVTNPTSNWGFHYLYIHGMQGAGGTLGDASAPYSYPDAGSQAVVYILGNDLYDTGGDYAPITITSNIDIGWNQIGSRDGLDCGPYMYRYQYYPDNTNGSNFGAAGGSCGVIGFHGFINNAYIHNNISFHVEQAGKCYEGNGSGTPPHYYTNWLINFLWQYNEFNQMHRIGYEGQCAQVAATKSTVSFDSNSAHTWYFPGYGSWPYSLPQSGGSNTPSANSPAIPAGYGWTNNANNVLIGDSTIPNIPSSKTNCYQFSTATSCYSGTSTGGYRYPGAVEFWGPGLATHNLAQSGIASGALGGYAPGYQIGIGAVNYTTFQSTVAGGGIVGSPEQGAPGPPPTQFGNVVQTAVTTFPSAAPTISPTPSGSYSSPITVTIADVGYTSATSTLPLGNTSVWYTTDGTNPVPGVSTVCGTIPSETQTNTNTCTISVAPGTTVKAIGHWGAWNQPVNYPSGYGFVPSGIVSAFYPASSGTPTLTGVSLTLQDGTSTVQTANSKQACANMTYTGGNTGKVCGSGSDQFGTTPQNWTSSNTAIATITSTGSVSGVTAGTTNLSVKAIGFTSAAFPLTVTAAAPVLQGIQISCPATLSVGQTGTCTCLGNYTGPTTGVCPSSLTYSSDTPADLTVNATSGALSAVAVGNPNITGSASGFKSTVPVSVTSNSPPAATLISIVVSCTPNFAFIGASQQCQATGVYSDGTQTNCTTTDSQGNLCTGWTSSSTGVATVNSTGLVTGVTAGMTNITVTSPAVTTTAQQFTVANPPSAAVLGTNNQNVAGTTYPNYLNSTYAVMGSIPSTVSSCTFYLPTGYTYTAGNHFDCGLIAATSSTTQSSAWTCHITYTTLGTSADVGYHTVSMTGCGTLPANSDWWIAVNTDLPGPIGEGFYNCGSSCNGTAPTSGTGTFPCAFVSASYGVYTGMGTAMTAGCGPTGTQASQYVTLVNPTPSLVGGYFTTPGLGNTLQVGKTIQIYAVCQYSDGTAFLCSPGADTYGNNLTSISSSNTSVATIGAVGSAHPGLLQGIQQGNTNITGLLTGGVVPAQYGEAVTVSATPLPPASPRQLAR